VSKAAPSKAGEVPVKRAAEPAAPNLQEIAAGIEQRIARSGFARKVRVEVRDGVIHLTGTLSPREIRALRSRFRPPPGVNVEYSFTSPETPARAEAPPKAAPAKPANTEEDPSRVRPQTAPGMAEIEVLTDVSGATAVLKGPQGNVLQQCTTPCRFEEVRPGRYGVEISKPGFSTERRIVNARPGNISEVQLSLRAAVARLQMQSIPAGAEIFVDGRSTGQRTPTTLNLSPGPHSIRLQRDGYSPYETSVTLAENDLKALTATLTERPQARGPGYVEIRTVPRGADILLNDTNTGLKSPARLELQPGEYTLTLYLKGYPPLREKIVVTATQTLQVNRSFSPP
jgi:hypothetical protein